MRKMWRWWGAYRRAWVDLYVLADRYLPLIRWHVDLWRETVSLRVEIQTGRFNA